MSLSTLNFDLYDQAIIRALRKHPEGIRNTKLNKEVKIDGKILSVKTYNKHLKWLVNEEVVERTEEGRAKVTYKLRSTEFKEVRLILGKRMEDLRNAMQSLFDERFAHPLPKDEAKDELSGMLFWNFSLLKDIIVSGLLHGDDNVEFSLRVNLAMEQIRELMITAKNVIEQDEDTSSYFHQLLTQIWFGDQSNKEETIKKWNKLQSM